MRVVLVHEEVKYVVVAAAGLNLRHLGHEPDELRDSQFSDTIDPGQVSSRWPATPLGLLGACRAYVPAAARAGIRLAALAIAKRPRHRFQLRLRAFRSSALLFGAIASLAFVGMCNTLLGHLLHPASGALGHVAAQ